MGIGRRNTSATLAETAVGEAVGPESRFTGRAIVADIGAGAVLSGRVLTPVFGPSEWLMALSLRADAGYGLPLSSPALGSGSAFLTREPTDVPDGASTASRGEAAGAGLDGLHARLGLAFGL